MIRVGLAVHECVNGYTDCCSYANVKRIIVYTNFINVFDFHFGAIHMAYFVASGVQNAELNSQQPRHINRQANWKSENVANG